MYAKDVKTEWGQPLLLTNFSFMGIGGEGRIEVGTRYEIFFRAGFNKNSLVLGVIEGWYFEPVKQYPIIIIRLDSTLLTTLHTPSIINYRLLS
jgi:hypothetical protein